MVVHYYLSRRTMPTRGITRSADVSGPETSQKGKTMGTNLLADPDMAHLLKRASTSRADLDHMLRRAITSAHAGRSTTPEERAVMLRVLDDLIGDLMTVAPEQPVAYPGHTPYAHPEETGWCADCTACPRHMAYAASVQRIGRCTCTDVPPLNGRAS